MGQIKHKMGSIGGGVDISHKSKMSGKAKDLMSFPGGMPGPGNYGQMDNKVVGKGMAQYLAGESVGMKKYGQHKGPEKALVGKQENLPEGLKAKIEAAPGMYGKKKKGMKQMGEMEEAPMSTGPAKTEARKMLKSNLDKGEKPVEDKKTGSKGPGKMTKGEKQADRAKKKKQRKTKRAEKRIERNESKQDRIKKNTQSSSDPKVRASGKARIERAKKRVKKNRTVATDYISRKDSNEAIEQPDGSYKLKGED